MFKDILNYCVAIHSRLCKKRGRVEEWKQELWDLKQTTSFPIYTFNIVSIKNIDPLLQINKTVWLAYIFFLGFQLVLNLKTKQHEAGKRKKILTFSFIKDEGFPSSLFI